MERHKLLVAYRLVIKTTTGSLAGALFVARAIWLQVPLAQLRECSELARKHYIDPASIPATQLSASKILDELKRFRARLFDVACENPSDTKEAKDLFQEFHGLITGTDDFQSGGRAVLDIDDPLFKKIRDCEESLARNLKKDRSAKP